MTTTAVSYLQSGDGSFGASPIGYTPLVGKPVFSVLAYRSASLDPATGDPIGYLNGVESKDYASITNLTTAGELVYYGSARPTTFGAFRNTFSYKGLSLSANIIYKYGYYFRRPTITYSSLASLWSAHEDFTSQWKKPGDEKLTNVPSMAYPFNASRETFYRYSEALVEKGDHIRLQDITLNYDIDKIQWKNIPFRSLGLYFYVNNIGILWKAGKSGLDPDFIQGYPNPTTYSIGCKVNFF